MKRNRRISRFSDGILFKGFALVAASIGCLLVIGGAYGLAIILAAIFGTQS